MESLYSVSPQVRLMSGIPNPREKTSTLTPIFLAARKWPSSWIKIREPIPTITRSMLLETSANGIPYLFPCPTVGRHDVLQRGIFFIRVFVHNLFYCPYYTGEFQPAFQKRIHRHLVGRIHYGGECPTVVDCPETESQRRESLQIGLGKGQPA